MLIDHLNQQLRERRGQGLWRERWVAESPCAPRQRVGREGDAPRELLAFCSNDYLGLAAHPAVVAALAEGAALYGAGSGASHLVSGHSRAHAMLEEALAATQAGSIPGCRAITFCTGYMANLALMAALGGAGTAIFTDKLNHASLIDGALLSRAEVQRYPHGRIDLLSERLARCTSPLKLIVTDAVFSMDGDMAPLPEILALAQRHDAWIVVDDAHGFGVLGAEGRGSLAHWGLRSERFILMGTLGKALGVAGAFVAAHPTVIEWLVQAARPYIYTTAAPPALAHALLTSLAITQSAEGDQRRAQLQTLVERLRFSLNERLQAHPQAGFRLMDSATPIQPLLVGSNEHALALAAALDAHDIRVPAIRPPTVPAGTARLRITLSAAHTLADVDRLCDALGQALRAAA